MSEDSKKDENSDSNSSDDARKGLSKEYSNLLKNSSDIFTIDQLQYLQRLVTVGELDKFERIYWKYLVKEKSKDTNLSNREHSDFTHENLSSDSEDSPFLRRTINSYREQLKVFDYDINNLKQKIIAYEKAIGEKNDQLTQSIAKIKNLEIANNELASRVQQERIDQKIPGYVDSVKKDLGTDDAHFISLSKTWAILGAIFGITAVVFSFISLYFSIDFKNAKGFELIYLFTRGLIGISILSWLSYICLSNSKKYTHESIRRKDRRHALMFGQVFLQIYGSTATKEEAVLVFKDWNMSGDSAFSDQTDHPPGIHSLWEATKEKVKSTISDKPSEPT